MVSYKNMYLAKSNKRNDAKENFERENSSIFSTMQYIACSSACIWSVPITNLVAYCINTSLDGRKSRETIENDLVNLNILS